MLPGFTQSSDLVFAVETGGKDSADLMASPVQPGATNEIFQTKIGNLAESIATAEADSTAAIVVQTKGHVDFERSEQELLDVIDPLARTIAILEGAAYQWVYLAGYVACATGQPYMACSAIPKKAYVLMRIGLAAPILFGTA